MRIVQFIDTLRSGGKERQLVELLKGLADAPDVQCELIVMSDDIHYDYLGELDIRVHKLIRNRRRDLGIFLRLFSLLRQIKPDLLHSWNSMCSIYALPATKFLNIKFVNGFLRDAPPSLSFGKKEWLRSQLTFPFSDAIVANSQAGLRAYKAPSSKGHYVYNGYDANRSHDLIESDEIKTKYHIKTDQVIGMVASFTDNKDFQTFIDAAVLVLKEEKDVTFLAIGDGKSREDCMQSVPDEFREFIKFTGKVKHVESLVQIMTIGVLCSNAKVHGEGISNSIMEYMALAKPVIATDCGGNKELILEGKSGYLVRDADPIELAERLFLLLHDNKWRQEMGETGRQHLHNNFSLECLTQNYIALYQGLLK